MSRPASRGSSESTRVSSAVPPPNRVVKSCLKCSLTVPKAASRRSRPSRLRLPIACRRRLIASTRSSRSAAMPSCFAVELGELLLGPEVHGAEALAVGLEGVQLGLDLVQRRQGREILQAADLEQAGRGRLDRLGDGAGRSRRGARPPPRGGPASRPAPRAQRRALRGRARAARSVSARAVSPSARRSAASLRFASAASISPIRARRRAR